MRSERIVAQVRGVVLLLAVLGAYLAQYLILNSSPADLIPPRLVNLFPFLSRTIHWRTAGLLPAALWVYLVSAIAFGLVTPIWRSERRTDAAQADGHTVLGRRREPWMYPLAAGGLLSLCAGLLRLAQATVWLGAIFWVVACGPFVYAGVRYQYGQMNGKAECYARVDRNPLDGWPYLLGILAVAAGAYLFRWLHTPIHIDRLSAEVGLMVQGQAGREAGLVVSAVPTGSLAATAIGTRLSGDGLVGARLAGLYAGLLVTGAVWLLAAELFRRSPNRGESQAVTDADARFNRVVATAIAAFGMPMLYFARVPIVLEGVAWGSLGIWALLYGLRTGLLPVVGASALLLGVSSLYGPSGLTFSAVGLGVWAGVFLVRPEWPGLHSRTQQRLRQPELLYWLAGLVIVLWPLLFGFLAPRRDSGAYLSFLAAVDGVYSSMLPSVIADRAPVLSSAAAGIQAAILAPSFASGTGNLFGVNAMMLSAVIAPLYVLGLGAVALNFDTLTGWTLASWMLLGTVLSVLFSHPYAPRWAALLAIWPAVALITAFALDRLRAGVSEFAGGWTRQASRYLVYGLIAAAAILGWLNYYEDAMSHTDAGSAAGREVRRAIEVGESPLIAVSEPWTVPELRTLASLAGVSVDGASALLAPAGQLPATLPPNVRLIVAAEDRPALEAVRLRYPASDLRVYRAHNGNPVVYSIAPESLDGD